MRFDDRLSKFIRKMEAENIDSSIFLNGPNMAYLCGYTGFTIDRLMALVVIRGVDKPIFIFPKLEEERVRETISLDKFVYISYGDQDNPIIKLVKLLEENDVEIIGVEGHMPYKYVDGILNHLKNVKIRVIDPLISSLRSVKEGEEILLIKHAVDINVNVFRHAMKKLELGISEKEFMNMIREISIRLGAESNPFIIVQFGSNSSKPHELPTNKLLDKNEIVLLDIGVTYKGYISDITRTVFMGEPDEKHIKIFNIVKEAQFSAISVVKPGISADMIDKAAREVIVNAGYGDWFIHGTGHGIGLEVHEEPYIRPGNLSPIKEKMVFTIEPGIYLPGEFGIRIEDDILVTKDGCEVLSRLPRSINITDYL